MACRQKPKNLENLENLENPENLENLETLENPKSLLIRFLDEAWSGAAWHGPTLSRAVRGVDARQAVWRPGPGRHSIREIVVHAAYWKQVVRRRLLGAARTAFPLPGANWFELPSTRPWRDDVRLLEQEHRALREAVAAYPRRALNRVVDTRGQTAAFTIRGIAAHDLYHAGQIQLLRAIFKGRRGRSGR